VRRLVAVLLGTVAGLLLCEAAVRLLSDRLLSLSHPAVRFDPALGWVQKAGETGVRKNELGQEVAIVGSPLGIRQPPRPYETSGRETVLVLGDSFTAGTQVRFEDAWPARLEALLRPSVPSVQVINAGVDRYDLCQEYRLADRLAARFRPRHIVVGLYVGNDIVDYDRGAGARPPWIDGGPVVWLQEHSYLFHFVRGTLARRKPPASTSDEPAASSVVLGWSPQSVPGFAEMRPDEQARVRGQFAAGDVLPVLKGGEESERRLRATVRVLEAMRIGGAALTVVLLPLKQDVLPAQRAELMALHQLSDDDLDRPQKALLARDGAGLRVVDPTAALRAEPDPSALYWRVDLHMTPLGHAVVAHAVAPVVLANWNGN
jgi:lysophospholipase L1-like esterase